MDHDYEFADTISFTASEFTLGRQRCRKWISLLTQQLRLRHVYQIYAFNIPQDRKANFYFTLHSTPMSSPFYTSEQVAGKHPKWNELLLGNTVDANVSSVVIRVWKSTRKGDEIILTWGVNFSGLVYLGNKICDLQPRCFKANSVIFFMQGVYFTSREYIRTDFEKPVPFQQNLNLVEKTRGEQVLYKRVAVRAPKGEVTGSYTVEKLRRLQELQRLIKKKKSEVLHVKERIKSVAEREPKQDVQDPHLFSYNNNVRFAPQLLTMNCLNKMLHEKPTKAERETMTIVSKKIEVCRFRLRLLHQERDRMIGSVRRLKQQESRLGEENEEKNSNLMGLYHALSKESHQWDEYRQSLPRQKEFLMVVGDQLRVRQGELLKELLFVYPIDKESNKNKYTMLGIHLPDPEFLLDYQDSGVSVVLGYICHILIMCSIFLQVPLRYPMKHFGSRSVIYNQVYPEIPDKEREFPLYTKGKDRGHFSSAVFLLNTNISQLRWYLHHKLTTTDLKYTLKNLRNLLLGEDSSGSRHILGYLEKKSKLPTSDASTSTLKSADSAVSLDKFVSPSLSSISSSNLTDPLLGTDRVHDEIRRARHVPEPPSPSAAISTSSPKAKLSIFKSSSTSPKRTKKDRSAKSTSEVLAVPEAYLNRQMSKDAFHKCASGGYNFGEKAAAGDPEENGIKVRQGVEEFQAKVDTISRHSDSIEEGTDPLNPTTNLEPCITKSIDINRDPTSQKSDRHAENNRISRSMDSYAGDEDDYASSFYKTCELGSDPMINASCDRIISSGSSSNNSNRKIPGDPRGAVGQQRLLEQLLAGDTSLLSSSELVFPEECLRMSLQDIASPLTERTNRLLSANQSFNLVKHRPMD